MPEKKQRSVGGRPKKPIKRKIRDEHGYPILQIPMNFLKALGLNVGQQFEIYLDKTTGTNPLAWEIRLRRVRRDEQGTEGNNR